jgi:hypothetical protein
MAAGNRHGTTHGSHGHESAAVSHQDSCNLYTRPDSSNGAHQMLFQTAILLHPVDQSGLGCQFARAAGSLALS